MHPIEAYIKKHGLTIKDFAEQTQMTREHIHALISGIRKRPRAENALKIERATNGEIKAEWLIFPERYKNEIEEYLNKNCCEAAT